MPTMMPGNPAEAFVTPGLAFDAVTMGYTLVPPRVTPPTRGAPRGRNPITHCETMGGDAEKNRPPDVCPGGGFFCTPPPMVTPWVDRSRPRGAPQVGENVAEHIGDKRVQIADSGVWQGCVSSTLYTKHGILPWLTLRSAFTFMWYSARRGGCLHFVMYGARNCTGS